MHTCHVCNTKCSEIVVDEVLGQRMCKKCFKFLNPVLELLDY